GAAGGREEQAGGDAEEHAEEDRADGTPPPALGRKNTHGSPPRTFLANLGLKSRCTLRSPIAFSPPAATQQGDVDEVDVKQREGAEGQHGRGPDE
ncbi:hypothetical protein THAOC_08259, partial [Thalassiosira oceanica]